MKMKLCERNIVLSIITLNIKQQICNSFIASPGKRKSPTNIVSLGMAKDSDRARIERDFEDMMGDDWRVFRAKLIAEEHKEAVGGGFDNENDWKNGHVDAFGRSFNRPQPRSSSSYLATEDFIQEYNELTDFNNNIGRVDPEMQDPFVSEAEKVAAKSCEVHFDKHRWAHPLSHVETGCVLIANEKLGGVFHQTVILIVNHDEHAGSTGVCINRPLPGDLLQVGSDADAMSNLDPNLKMAFNEASVSYGGPVMEADYSVLHGFGEVEGAKKVAPGVFVGGSRELMNCVEKKNINQADVLFVKGHAAWIPSQMEREVSKGVWHIASVSPDFILRYAGAPISQGDNVYDLWADILTCMGGKYAQVASRYAGRGDMRMMP